MCRFNVISYRCGHHLLTRIPTSNCNQNQILAHTPQHPNLLDPSLVDIHHFVNSDCDGHSSVATGQTIKGRILIKTGWLKQLHVFKTRLQQLHQQYCALLANGNAVKVRTPCHDVLVDLDSAIDTSPGSKLEHLNALERIHGDNTNMYQDTPGWAEEFSSAARSIHILADFIATLETQVELAAGDTAKADKQRAFNNAVAARANQNTACKDQPLSTQPTLTLNTVVDKAPAAAFTSNNASALTPTAAPFVPSTSSAPALISASVTSFQSQVPIMSATSVDITYRSALKNQVLYDAFVEPGTRWISVESSGTCYLIDNPSAAPPWIDLRAAATLDDPTNDQIWVPDFMQDNADIEIMAGTDCEGLLAALERVITQPSVNTFSWSVGVRPSADLPEARGEDTCEEHNEGIFASIEEVRTAAREWAVFPTIASSLDPLPLITRTEPPQFRVSGTETNGLRTWAFAPFATPRKPAAYVYGRSTTDGLAPPIPVAAGSTTVG